jgi:hypothetical protein
MDNSKLRPSPSAYLSRWHAYYIVYHADLNMVITLLLAPLVSELLRTNCVDRFFFVRYSLGGPHVRLRWRLTEREKERVAEERLSVHARRFFEAWPSRRSSSEDDIKRMNKLLLASDPLSGEGPDLIYPDNHWLHVPLELDIDRYGGVSHLEASMDMFCLSSLWALKILKRRASATNGKILREMMRLSIHLAIGFAVDQGEFLQIIAYSEKWKGDNCDGCLGKADAVFRSKRHDIVSFVLGEIRLLFDGAVSRCPNIIASAALYLVAEVNDLPQLARQYMAASHVHMTANRLGLTNQEEAYIGRLLWSAVQALSSAQDREWLQLWDRHARWHDHCVPQALERHVVEGISSMCK